MFLLEPPWSGLRKVRQIPLFWIPVRVELRRIHRAPLPVTGVAIGVISSAGDASVSAMIVSTASAFPFSVISTESLACLQVALPPVRLEQPNILAGRAGSKSALPVGLRIYR